MDFKTKRIVRYAAAGLILIGQVLPWAFGQRPFDQARDFLFSRVSQPNAEWLIWFLAPITAAVFGTRGVARDFPVPKVVLVPIVIFLVTWAALFLTHTRRYLQFTQFPILATFAGLLLLAVAALLPE